VFKVISEPKLPTGDDVARGAQHWREALVRARASLAKAEDGRARRHAMERISFCQIALWQAEREG
jgi:hypothetical protein